jgi:hypothetical protein
MPQSLQMHALIAHSFSRLTIRAIRTDEVDTKTEIHQRSDNAILLDQLANNREASHIGK